MNSKFWAGGDISSEEEEVNELVPEINEPKKKFLNTMAVLSSSEGEQTRVVKTFKDRQWDNLRSVITQMQNHIKIDDFVQLTKDYESLMKYITKASQIVQQEGYPKFFIKALYQLDEYVSTQLKDKETFKKLSKNRASSLNTLKSKFRKLPTEWIDMIQACKNDPFAFDESDLDDEDDDIYDDDDDDEDDDEDDDDDDDDEIEKGYKQYSDDDDDDDDEDDSEGENWSDTENISFSEDEDDAQKGRSKWLKKDISKLTIKQPIKVIKKPQEKKHIITVEKPDTSAIPKDIEGLLDTTEVNTEIIQKRIKLIIEKRGKKGIDKYEQISILKKLLEISKNVSEQSFMDVLAQLITAEFDISPGPTTCQPVELWLDTYDHMSQILKILENNPNAHLTEITTSEESQENENPHKTNISIFSAFLERLDDEVYKFLQLKDLHSDLYKVRLGHTIDLLVLLSRFYEYTKNIKCVYMISSVCLSILEQIYNKINTLAAKTWSLVSKRSSKTLTFLENVNFDPHLLVQEFYNNIAKYGNHREKVHAQLYLSYNYCLHDMYYEGKDLLQISNIHDLCMQLDVHTQILYNRNLVQLAFAAFRKGLIQETYSYLVDICMQNHHKELLAQALSTMKNQEKTIEQEKAERRRLLPYHLHINLELVEGIHNICAMLLEVPSRARNKLDGHNYIYCRQFAKMFEIYISQTLQGPPENNREMVMCATKALIRGDWKECSQHIFNLNIWTKIQNYEKIQKILLQKIKIEAMRTYIFSYLSVYDSFSVTNLSSMFSLEPNQVHSVVSKMMVNEEIWASWDETSQNIIINKIEPTPLQQLSLSLSENLQICVEQNELTLNMKNHKFVLAHDKRPIYQQYGDRHHWGVMGDTFFIKQRNNFGRSLKKQNNNLYRNKPNRPNIYRRNNANQSNDKMTAFKTMAIRQLV